MFGSSPMLFIYSENYFGNSSNTILARSIYKSYNYINEYAIFSHVKPDELDAISNCLIALIIDKNIVICIQDLHIFKICVSDAYNNYAECESTGLDYQIFSALHIVYDSIGYDHENRINRGGGHGRRQRLNSILQQRGKESGS